MTDSLRTDLNDFLFTPIADDANGMHLTMLSALARSGVDPWIEAAGLAALPRENATHKLELMLSAVPNGPPPGDATATLAARLVAQLHASPKPVLRRAPPLEADSDPQSPLPSFATLPKRVRWAIYSLVALFLIVVGHRAFSGGEVAKPADTSHQQPASN